jgi:hypothetical protein
MQMKKKISELTPEEQGKIRAYNRENKRKSREKERAAQTLSAEEWTWNFADNFPEQHKELNAYVRQIEEKVVEELGRGLGTCAETYTVDRVARTLFSLKRNSDPWVRQVHSPNGIIVGGSYFPEALGSDLISSAHKLGLKKSPTFTALYIELLRILDKKFGHIRTGDAFELGCAADIKAELAGTYVLPAPPSGETIQVNTSVSPAAQGSKSISVTAALVPQWAA